MSRIQDAEGRTTHFTYTSGGRLESVRDARMNVTQYVYTSAGCAGSGGTSTPRLTAIIDANDHCTEFHYDGLGRLRRVINPLQQLSRDNINYEKSDIFIYDLDLHLIPSFLLSFLLSSSRGVLGAEPPNI